MSLKSMLLALVLCAVSIAGCATRSPRLVYEESQFANRLEYLRFCQRYAMFDNRCV
jgi:hypothetical protein